MRAYTILDCATMASEPERAPPRPGLYLFLLKRPSVLDDALLRSGADLESLRLGARRALYLGSSADDLRRRLKAHLAPDSRGSNFRQSLGLLLTEALALEPVPNFGRRYFHFAGEGEARLTAWIAAELEVAWRCRPRPEAEERRLIELERPLLNIRHRHETLLARRLKAMRRAQSGLGLRPPPPPRRFA